MSGLYRFAERADSIVQVELRAEPVLQPHQRAAWVGVAAQSDRFS